MYQNFVYDHIILYNFRLFVVDNKPSRNMVNLLYSKKKYCYIYFVQL